MRLLFRQVYNRSVTFIASEDNAVKVLYKNSVCFLIFQSVLRSLGTLMFKLKISLMQILTTSEDEFCSVI